MYQDLSLRKRRSQEGTRNVRKFRKNHRSNRDFACKLKTPPTNIATIINITFTTLKRKKSKGAPKWLKYRKNRKNNKINEIQD